MLASATLGLTLAMGLIAPGVDVTPSFAQQQSPEAPADERAKLSTTTPSPDEEPASSDPDADTMVDVDNGDDSEEAVDTLGGETSEDLPEPDTQASSKADDQETDEVLKDHDPGVSLLSVDEFNDNPNVYYALDRQDDVNVGSWWSPTYVQRIRIRQLTFNINNATPVAQGNIVMGGPRDLADIPGRVANALGVTQDGTFYFTTQQGTASQSGTVDIWRYEMMSMPGTNNPGGTCWNNQAPTGSNAEGWACPPQRIVSNLSLNSRGGGTIVGGAVNPRDGAFYFMYFSGTPSSSPLGSGNVRAHLYRYDQTRTTIGQPAAGEVAHFDIESPSAFTDLYNGDIAFDAVGNLLLTVSNNGGNYSRGRAMLATLTFDQFADLPTIQWTDSNTPSVPTLLPASTIGAEGQVARFNPRNGVGLNGLAYLASGEVAMEQGNAQMIANPATFDPIGNARTNPAVTGEFVDLASSVSPPVLTVQKFVENERFAKGDQFTLSGQQTLAGGSVVNFDAITTTGNEAGLQSEQIGPVPLISGGTITVGEAITANAENYSSNYECFLENRDGSKGRVFKSGEGRQVTFDYLQDVPGAQSGPQQMKCVFTNGPLRPNLETAKTANPESTTSVSAGDTVQYKLEFDNSTGLADAEVNHIDHLADVLDDADIVPNSIRYGNGSETQYPATATSPLTSGVEAEFSPEDSQIAISGTVPAESTRTVWFAVTVKENDSERSDSETNTNFVLNNYLRPVDEDPPTVCETDDPNCTTHPIEAWTVTKSSQPPNGAWLHEGGNVYYKVDVTKVGAQDTVIEGIQVVDDMSEVMAVARMDPKAPSYGPQYKFDVKTYDADDNVVRSFAADPSNAWDNGATFEKEQLYPAHSGSPDPSDDSWTWTTTLPEFTLATNEVRAQIVYIVKVGGAADPDDPTAFQMEHDTVRYPPTILQPFMNTVGAESTTLPPNECVLGETPVDPQCQVTHTIGDNYFHIQKNSTERNAAGNTEWNLAGAEYEIRDATLASGWPAESASANLCWSNYAATFDEDSNTWTLGDPIGTYSAGATMDWEEGSATYQSLLDYNNYAQANGLEMTDMCALFYPLVDDSYGQAAGTWHGRNLAEGSYELIETKAPEGHQLLAQPIPFVVGPEGSGHQLDLPDPDNAGEYLERCTNPEQLPSNGTEACVMQTGWLVQLYDTKLQALPLSGGPSALWFAIGGAIVLLAGGLGATWVLRHRIGRQEVSTD